jgi:hypothetical protein
VLALGQPTSGGFQGVVVDSHGNAIAGAQVSYSRIFRTVPDDSGRLVLAPGEAIANGVLASGTGGGFTASGLPLAARV